MKITTTINKLMITASVIFLVSLTNSHAHFGSRGPFGGSVSCAIVKDSMVYFGTNTGGVYENTNSLLVNWRPRPVGLMSGKINALAHTGSYLFAATDSGVYRFTGYIGNDRYWEKTNAGLQNISITSLVAIDSITLLAGTDGNAGVYLTSDKGATWTISNINMQHFNVNGFAKAGNRIIQLSDGGLWASDNNGQSWFDFNDVNTDNIDASAISYNASTDELLVYNSVGLYTLLSASTTGAPAYVSAQSNLPVGAIVRSISNNGTSWYVATSMGVYTSPTGTISWTSENTGITTQDVTAIVAYPFQNGIVAFTNNHGIFKTPASAISWTVMNTGFNNLETYSLIAKDTVLVVAATERGVYVSKDIAFNWTLSNNGLTDSLNVNDLGFFGNTLIAVTQNAGVFMSSDTGASWVSFNTNLSNMNIRKVKASGSHVYLIDSNGEIFQSDLTSSWSTIQSGLPVAVVPTSMAFYSGNILLGTYGTGIYTRPESTGSWTQFNSGLSNLNVTSVTANNQNKIFAGTDGNGVYVSDATTINWAPTSTLLIPFMTVMGLNGSNIQYMAFYAGYVFASVHGTVLATSDNGVTWIEAGTQFNLPSYTDVHKISFVTTRLFVTTENNSLYSNGLSELPAIIGIAENNSNGAAIIAYPNPGTGDFFLNYNMVSEKIMEVAVVDAAGKVVKHFMEKPVNKISLDCRQGIYFLRVTTVSGVINQKLIVQ